MKYCLLILFLLTLIPLVKAQSTKSVQLKPIFKNGKRYFYDGKRMNSAYSLEIPLASIQDEQINKYFNKFKTFQRLRALVYLPCFAYMLYNPINTSARANTLLVIFAAGVVGEITLNTIGHYQMNKAIDLYNISIMQRTAIGLRLEKTNKDTALCLGFSLKL